MADTQAQPREGLADIEVRSIDYIPASERHGRVRDQFTLWFAATMNIFNIVLGGVAVFLGLDFLWACIAIVLGTVIGLLLVGFHAIQGPKLGVPQMIQSRGQFGFYGAVIPFVFSIVLDFGFLAAQLVIQADAMNLLIGSISIPGWIALLTIPVFFLAIWGYKWIHHWQRVLTVVLGITFVIVFIQALSYGGLNGAPASTHAPSFALFMGATGLFVIDMISWAPYVSDYSRYLPENVSKSGTFWAVFLGNAINAYTGMLALASILSCFMEVRRSQLMRIVGCVLMILAGMICALVGYKDFVNNLSNFLDVLLFVFIPWSAINLADYYLIKHGDYDVRSFFTPDGEYGGFLWRGLIPYALAIAAEIPFIDQTFYTGPLVKPLGGVDISWVVGGVAGFVFYMIAMAIPINGKTALGRPKPDPKVEPAPEVKIAS
jgi:NCS1 family nucleobase:cation symporter-1